MRRSGRPLWQCPDCGREFANRGQVHACGTHALAPHVDGRPAEVRALFDAFVAAVRALGPCRVLPQKTRVAFQVRMTFAQLTVRGRWVDGHLVLARRVEGGPFRRVDSLSPRNHVHHFRLQQIGDVAALAPWLAESYAVGAQQHLQ